MQRFSLRRPGWTSHQCFLRPTTAAHFHTHITLRAGNTNFYEVLEIQPGASQSDIKKQFYRLSKLHHPDLHPDNDSQRFVAISTAYHTLGDPQKRAKYDREHLPASRASSSAPTGSYSSAQASPFGGRPASGLSKRRSTFRGPPPSFYRSGGWGKQGEKRRAAAEGTGEAAGSAAAGSSGGGGGGMGGGFGPGQASQKGFEDDVPHFDRQEHYRRQEAEDERARRRRQRIREAAEREAEGENGDVLVKGVVVTAAVGLAIILAPWNKKDKKVKEKSS